MRNSSFVAKDAIKADFLGYDILIAPQAAMIGGAWQGKDAAGKPQVWDPETLKFFLEKCDKSASPFIIDIGANTGCYCLLPIINRKIFCFAFEPNPETYRLLKENIILNDICDNIQTLPIALSNTVGEMILKIPSSGIASGLACLGIPKRFKEWREISVPTDTLDNVVARSKIQDIGLIKIDTEGCELFVLEGAKNCIHKFKPDILVEFEEQNTAQFGYHPDSIRILLESWGYAFTRLNKNDAFFTYKFHGDIIKI